MTDLVQLKADFEKAYEVLKSASSEYAKTSLALEKAKREYEVEKGKALLDGNIEGKNAEIREADARRFLMEYFVKLAETEDAFSNAKSAFAIAATHKEELEIYLRIAELEHGIRKE